MVAGHVSATLDEGTGGDVGGHVPFSPLVDALQSTWISATMSGRAAVSDARLLRRRRLQGPARHHRAQPAHPPRRHDAPTTRHTSHTTRSGTSQHSFGHEDEGADIQQHISAATGDPDGLHRSDMRSAVLVTYPPSHSTGISTSPTSMAMPRPTAVLQ